MCIPVYCRKNCIFELKQKLLDAHDDLLNRDQKQVIPATRWLLQGGWRASDFGKLMLLWCLVNVSGLFVLILFVLFIFVYALFYG
jgi:hypothetical protein